MFEQLLCCKRIELQQISITSPCPLFYKFVTHIGAVLLYVCEDTWNSGWIVKQAATLQFGIGGRMYINKVMDINHTVPSGLDSHSKLHLVSLSFTQPMTLVATT